MEPTSTSYPPQTTPTYPTSYPQTAGPTSTGMGPNPVIQSATKESKVVVEVRPVDKVDLFKVMAFLFVCGSAVLIQSARICRHEVALGVGYRCRDETAFAVAVGGLGILFSWLLMLSLLFPVGVCKMICQAIGVINAAVWTAGAGVCTFVDPFTVLGNGYFALWLGFTGAFYFLFLVTPEIDRFFDALASLSRTRDIDHRTVTVILFASIIYLTQISVTCNVYDTCSKQYAWAIVAGAFSTFWTLIYLLFFRFLVVFRAFFAIILLLVWIPGCGFGTFDKPFVVPGNGYFSAWVAFFFTGYWAIIAVLRSP